MPFHVVKVGGSLFDLPDLGLRLRRFFSTLQGQVLLFPGGGLTAEAVRELDRIHLLGEEASHWLALRALSINACFLARLLPNAPIIASLSEAQDQALAILDPLPLAEQDDQDPGACPHAWSVTSDSLALRAAQLLSAQQLILLKSTDGTTDLDWQAAAKRGLVDDYFPLLHARQPIAVRWVNLRKPGNPGRSETD